MRKLFAGLLAAVLLAAALLPGLAETPDTGGTVIFGAYEQDGDAANGPEPIEWLVLEVRDGAALLISRRVLDACAFHPTYASVTWEQSGMRGFLNGEFLAAAFTGEEQAAILAADLDNGPAQSDTWCADGGPATRDLVFLLSFAEAGLYFPEDSARLCAPTAFALARGARVNESNPDPEGSPACWWWLRSPGFYRYNAATVLASGARVNQAGVTGAAGGVRPCLWVRLDALTPAP